MNLLTTHIEYLIKRYDCVIVPGFGAFIAQYQSARIEETSGIIQPPSRCIAFNESVQHNDGLLASSVSRRSGISFDCAMNKISEEASVMRQKIFDEGKIDFGNLGSFRTSAEADGGIEFLPDPDGGINEEVYQLRPISIIRVLDRAAAEAPAYCLPRKKSGRILPPGTGRYFAELLKFAAALAVIVALCVSLINFMPFSSTEEINYASLSPTGTQQYIEANDDVAEMINESVPQSLPLAPLAEGQGVAEYESPVYPTAEGYYVIVASFPTTEQAEKYISDSGYPSLKIIKSPTRARVYAASASTLQDALSITKRKDITDRYRDVWILHQ